MSLIDKTTGDYTIAALGDASLPSTANGTIFLSSGQVIVSGSLIVNGQVLNPGGIPDPVFESNLLTINAVVSPTNTSANSGGLLLKGTTDKSLRWYLSTNAWTSNVNFNLSNIANAYYINGVMVLNATSLGSGIVIDGGTF